MITVDCDVLQADGGTRTASITGGFIALLQAVSLVLPESRVGDGPLTDSVAAVSCGLIDEQVVLDLDYKLDSAADVDMNVIMTGSGRFVEIQAQVKRPLLMTANWPNCYGWPSRGFNHSRTNKSRRCNNQSMGIFSR